MWLMVQQDEGDDYVVATGVTRSVRDLVETAFEHVGLDWREYVHIDESLQRGTAELHNLVGDPAKAKRELGWEPTVSFEGLVQLMVDAELERLRGEVARATSRPARASASAVEAINAGSPFLSRSASARSSCSTPSGARPASTRHLPRCCSAKSSSSGASTRASATASRQHGDPRLVLVPAAMRLSDSDHRLDARGLVGSCVQAPPQVVERLVGSAEDARRVAQIAQQPRLGARVALRQLRLGSGERGFDRLGVGCDLAQPFVPLGERGEVREVLRHPSARGTPRRVCARTRPT